MSQLSTIGLGAFIEEILVGLGNGLLALAPGVAVIVIVGGIAAGLTVLFRNIFKKASK